MIAMAAHHKPGSGQAEFDIDFSEELPRWDFFPVWWLAEKWHVSTQHIFNLIETGELPVPIDLRNKASSRSLLRVPRKALIEFLNRRKDLEATASKAAKERAKR